MKQPEIIKHHDPITDTIQVVVVMKWQSEAEYAAWLAQLKEELKPVVLRELQSKARSLFADVFGVELK